MDLYSVSEQINQLSNEWHNFKQQNDIRLKSLETKGSVDSITTEQINKLNKNIDDLQLQIKAQEVASLRPGVNTTSYAKENTEHKKAFLDYIRKGNDYNLAHIEQKALSISNDSDGGYFVTRQVEHNILTELNTLSTMRKLADIQYISSDGLEIIEDFDNTECGWTTETGSIKETKTPRLLKKIIPVHEIYAQPKATQKLIDDSAIDIEKWLEQKLSTSFLNLEEESFIKGDGIGKPKGILSYADGNEWGKIEQIKSGIVGGLKFPTLHKLIYSLSDYHRQKASIIINRQTSSLIRSLKNEHTGEYLWAPESNSNGQATILGIPVHHSDHMPISLNNEIALALGNFKEAYQIVDRQNIKLMRDPFTEKPFVKFYATKRVGGDIKNFNAIKLLKLSA
ncbi:phage major capsid protein [Rickettsiales endosymbiont of Stachyamoeba lipophora]|uniref:phage major capsid protein n=1 Tax=Rickettsiales endosymbiont of Stachyamoeba lipophora TaxID=2486578 RepID=UPI000F64FC59|nr:phage major capsid protein [Rickettsiales endosymbiont of Stachyamoeba lipophora]AZL15555.1 phage major capsid protein [Rickettsiales endosymbiont of Stachyamoeba lipophora]